jgi:hypothetical protein
VSVRVWAYKNKNDSQFRLLLTGFSVATNFLAAAIFAGCITLNLSYLQFNVASYRRFFEDAVSALIIGAIPSTVAIPTAAMPTIVASLIVRTRPSYEVITVIFAL